MGLLSRSSKAEHNGVIDGTHPQQHDHHLGRDAALVGGAVALEEHHHHNKKRGSVGGLFHRKDKNDVVATNGNTVGADGVRPVAPAAAVAAAAPVGTNHLTNGYGSGAAISPAGSPTTPGGTRTSPTLTREQSVAYGAAMGHTISPSLSRDAGPVGTPANSTLKEANKLDRKSKMEDTMGTLLCNSTMKHKAATHHAQADHLRMQASELSEAQRLEHEAGLRRQRAVGLGADPVHASGTTGFAPQSNNNTAIPS